ncbi:cell division control protein 48 homolog C [Tanacetum coccineum]
MKAFLPELLHKDIFKLQRFGKSLDVPLPNANERASILKALGRKMPLDTDVDLDALGRSDECKGYSGADLKRLMNAIEEEAAATSAKAGTTDTSAVL